MYSYRIYQVADGEWAIRRSVWGVFEVQYFCDSSWNYYAGWSDDRVGRWSDKGSALRALRHALAITGVPLSEWRKIEAKVCADIG